MFCLLNSLSNSHSNKLRLQLREFSIYFFIPPRLVQTYEIHIFVVVQFYPWFKFYFLLFLGMVMYDNDLQTKENKI